MSQDRDSFSGEESYFTNLTVRFWGTGRGADLTQQDCSDLVATFWSGRSTDYHVKAEYLSNSCTITVDYARETRHAFYSLDEDGTLTARVPASSVCPRSSPLSADAACQTGCPKLLDTTAPQFYRLLG